MGTKRNNQGLSRFMRRQTLNQYFFIFSAVYRDHNPGQSWLSTAQAFKKRFNIDDEEVSDEALVRSVSRMFQYFLTEGI